MGGLVGLLRLSIFIYIGVALLVVAFGYEYVGKHYPKVNLPYKEQVFGLRKIIIDKVDGFIEEND
jgi:hypothetical protein